MPRKDRAIREIKFRYSSKIVRNPILDIPRNAKIIGPIQQAEASAEATKLPNKNGFELFIFMWSY